MKIKCHRHLNIVPYGQFKHQTHNFPVALNSPLFSFNNSETLKEFLCLYIGVIEKGVDFSLRLNTCYSGEHKESCTVQKLKVIMVNG